MSSISTHTPAPRNATTVNVNLLRRVADRCGYKLVKSRTRDPHAVDYGLFGLLVVQTGGYVYISIDDRGRCGLTLEEVEAYLNEPA